MSLRKNSPVSVAAAAGDEAVRKYGRAAWLETPRLLFFHELPSWQQDNEHILSSYRPTSGSAWKSVTSLLYLNNQTVNTYSHLIGALAFLLLPFYFYNDVFLQQPEGRKEDVLVVSIYCFGVAVCFIFSTIFHTLWNHSHAVCRFCNKLDYLGILVLMWGAGIPTIYYGFICNHTLRVVYWTMTSSTALCCMIFTLTPAFVTPQYRHIRASFYAGFGLSSIIFVAHGLLLHGWELQKSRMSLVWMGWMATANLVGAAIYAARIPERWVPYTFDNFGASHQILHMAVMVAAWIHFRGLIEAFHIIRSQHNICGTV
ncbi:hemolysin-III channel protein Izh2, putative [Cordyceps militaris CM01]|uniref:Hemolysin-III channel protein Izh2, putative n=1 Tax=Cordyceps militaris (strain CM01) TaxID=983644 RepID=G3JT11_CORMM|nr:hemolysin-III channel protein Izh2, putative [Cordyceps militaris CM01]EGX89007.1 hemolysin-III channel protein Izh2, putative [Cordyceps militaris CM01]